MNKKQLIFSMLLGSAALSTAGNVTPEMQQTIERTEMYYQEIDRNAKQLVGKANALYGERRYEEAINLYIAAKLRLTPHSNAPDFAKQIEYCDKQIAECYYSWAVMLMNEAEDLAQQRNFEEAIALCRKALKFCPEQAGNLEKKIAYLEKRRDLAIARDAVSETTLVPNKENQAYQIEILMEQGRRLVAAKDYSRALRKFQEVLLITPYHSGAMQCIQGINHQIGKLGLQRYTDIRRDLIAETEWKTAIPFRPDANSEAGENLLEDGKPVVKAVQDNDELNKKLESIVIPEGKGDFPDVSIVDAVKVLADSSMQFDPEKRGVNFLLRRPVKTVAATDNAAPAAGSSDVYVSTNDADKNALTGDDLLDKKVDLNFSNKTLLTALRQLCQRANLRYRIEKYAVVIAPPNVALDELEAKLFAVDIPQGESDDSIHAKCEACGVTFPDGAKLFYDNKINRLVAINTAENLRMIEEKVLPQYDIKTPMIQIMIKFIEITQNDLDELAFNWQFGLNTNSPSDSATWSTRSDSSNQLLRYYTPDDTSNAAAAIMPANDANLQFIWQNDNGLKISAQMFALNWADSTDILYSPRVTTLDKTTAHIGMYTERYFPKDWEVPDIESSDVSEGQRLTDIDPQPTLDNLQKLGLSFDITPEIRDLDNGLIYVPVNFPIRLLSGWKTYDARYDKDGNKEGEYYKMPIFDDRTITTEVMVRDGETVILSGLATDVSKITHDKIPLLGDIPLLGRLFQSRYTKSEKGNLLIFLTCRLVKSDGTAYNPAASDRRRGMPNFGRME